MGPLLEAIKVCSLSSLNLCRDPRGVRFGNVHFLVALQHWVPSGWGRQWRQRKRVEITVQWTVGLVAMRPLYDPAVQHQYEGTGAGTRPTPTAFAS